MTREELNQKLKGRFNGSEIMNSRRKVDQESLIDKELTIDSYDQLGGSEDHYFAVVFKEAPDVFILSGAAITELIDTCEEVGESAVGVKLTIGKKVKTKKGQSYTPITIL